MIVNLSPVAGVAGQFFDNNGVPLSGGKLYTYVSGTTTPQAAYTSALGTTAHANPIVLDSGGRVPGGEIWLTDGSQYKFVLNTSVGVLVGTWDNIWGMGDVSRTTPLVYNATGNGSSVAYSTSSAPLSENTTQVFINGVYQQKNTYSVAGVVITFSEAPPANATIEIMYY